MFSPSHSCCSADSKKSSVPCPGLLKGPAKGTKLIKFTAPRYHPVSARLFRKPCGAQNAVTGRTVRPYCRSGRPLGSELQPAPARKPSQPVKLLSLLRCACLLSPSLRLEYSGRGHFDNRESSYHILGRFASGAGRFRGISAFFCVLLGDFLLAEACRQRQALSVTTPEPRRLSGQVPKYQRTNTVKRTLPRWQTCVLLAK